jgi:hypothetical protein
MSPSLRLSSVPIHVRSAALTIAAEHGVTVKKSTKRYTKPVLTAEYWVGLCGYLPAQEYRFAAHAYGGIGPGVRKRLLLRGFNDWRFDWAFPQWKIAVEIEGGVWLSKYGGMSRHFTGAGAIGDMCKYNAAEALGWHVLRYRWGKKWPVIDGGQVRKLIERQKSRLMFGA